MAIKRMNHAVLYVRDADRTFAFYRDVLGFRLVGEFPGAKFLQAPDSTNDHDLALFSIGDGAGESTAGKTTVGGPQWGGPWGGKPHGGRSASPMGPRTGHRWRLW